LESRENFPGKTLEGFSGNFPGIPLVLGKALEYLKDVPERFRKLPGKY
jgi:hypothetical protein